MHFFRTADVNDYADAVAWSLSAAEGHTVNIPEMDLQRSDQTSYPVTINGGEAG